MLQKTSDQSNDRRSVELTNGQTDGQTDYVISRGNVTPNMHHKVFLVERPSYLI